MATAKRSITFEANTKLCEQIDQIAQEVEQDRSYILNQAIETYLDIYNWQVEHIKKGLKHAQNGEFVEEKQWRAAFKREC